MLKKKSYMNINNILNEDAISSFLKGLFTGKSSASEKKLRKNMSLLRGRTRLHNVRIYL